MHIGASYTRTHTGVAGEPALRQGGPRQVLRAQPPQLRPGCARAHVRCAVWPLWRACARWAVFTCLVSTCANSLASVSSADQGCACSAQCPENKRWRAGSVEKQRGRSARLRLHAANAASQLYKLCEPGNHQYCQRCAPPVRPIALPTYLPHRSRASFLAFREKI